MAHIAYAPPGGIAAAEGEGEDTVASAVLLTVYQLQGRRLFAIGRRWVLNLSPAGIAGGQVVSLGQVPGSRDFAVMSACPALPVPKR